MQLEVDAADRARIDASVDMLRSMQLSDRSMHRSSC